MRVSYFDAKAEILAQTGDATLLPAATHRVVGRTSRPI